MIKQDMQMVKGSYSSEDVVFLLKDLSDVNLERKTDERERAIQQGVHYSEMLPVEYEPTKDYLALFHESLDTYKQKVAVAVGTVAELIVEKKGRDIVLVSLARAGTPIGVLIKRYIKKTFGFAPPHYSVSIIRGRGIDENALLHILHQHPNSQLVFIDGWTGKGAITKELTRSIHSFEKKYGTKLDDELAVLADPGYCSSLYGTREDFLIPNACLNSTVSGLVSRTILNKQWISETDFHGAKVYKELQDQDVSTHYIEVIADEFDSAANLIGETVKTLKTSDRSLTWEGLKSIHKIQTKYGLEDINLIKPGMGETTRVLLRRMPWKILVKDRQDPRLKHILQLTKERGVPVEEFTEMTYTCCGLIKPLERDQ